MSLGTAKSPEQLCTHCLALAPRDRGNGPFPWVVVIDGRHLCALHESRRRREDFEDAIPPAFRTGAP